MCFLYFLADLPFEMPAWAISDECQAWLCGFFLGASVRLVKAALRWFKRIGTEKHY